MGRGTRPEHTGGGLVALLIAAGQLLQRIPRRSAWIPVLLWMALISFSSELPGRPGGGSPAWALLSNLAHAPLFGLLGLWMALLVPRVEHAWGLGTWPRLDRRAAIGVLAGVGAFGFVDELHQLATGRRDFSLLDLGTDVAAAACVLWVASRCDGSGATSTGLAGRLLVSAGVCLLAAAVATWLPGFFPGVGWM